MALFRKDVFGNRLFIKRILILFFGAIAFYRFLRVNTTSVKGWEVLHKLPKTNEQLNESLTILIFSTHLLTVHRQRRKEGDDHPNKERHGRLV